MSSFRCCACAVAAAGFGAGVLVAAGDQPGTPGFDIEEVTLESVAVVR